MKLIIFDAGELLFPIPREKFAKKINTLEIKYNVKKGRCEEAWKEVKPLIMSGKVDYITGQEMIFKKAGFGDNSRKVAEEWVAYQNKVLSNVKPFRDVRLTLKCLKNKYKLVVLSDTHQTKEEKCNELKRMDIDFFDEVFCSNELGSAKTSFEAYNVVLNYFGLSAGDAIFVGHDIAEIKNAKRLGMTTIGTNKECGAKFFAEKFSEILKIIENIEE